MNSAAAYPKVSIISINYNRASVTNKLLKSLKQINFPNIEVIVVDDAVQGPPSSCRCILLNS